MHTALFLLLVIAAGIAFAMAWRIRQRSHARRQAIRAVLDAADALEAGLRATREEIQAVAGDHENPVRGAMQDLLRQRLWLQEHAISADLAQLAVVRQSLDAARVSLEEQLRRISRARVGGAA
jgi:hypothetical protein